MSKTTAGGTARYRYRVVIRWSEKIPVLELKKFAHLGPAKKHAALHAGNAEGPAWIQELHGSEWRDIEEAANAAHH